MKIKNYWEKKKEECNFREHQDTGNEVNFFCFDHVFQKKTRSLLMESGNSIRGVHIFRY